MRVVVDTSVVVSALRSRHGASNRLLEIGAEGGFSMLVTPALFLEYEAVLTRSEQMEAHGRNKAQVRAILRNLGALMEPDQVYFKWRPQLRDPNDELVLEAAINGRADCIVTHNVKDFPGVLHGFGIRILRPRELLVEVAL